MDLAETKDFWRWKLFKKVADFIHEPTDCNTGEIQMLLEGYRQHIQDITDHEDDTWYLDVC